MALGEPCAGKPLARFDEGATGASGRSTLLNVPTMENRPRILIFNDGYSIDDIADIPHEQLEVTCVPQGSREQLLAMIGDYDAYVSTLRIRVDDTVLDRAPRLRLLATNSTGTDHLDLDRLRERGITVLSIKNDRDLLDQISSTAELAFGLLITCARHLPLCFEATRQGRWERHKFAGQQLSDKTLGIVGMGRLGTMMARYGQAFRMKVIGVDPHEDRFPAGVERVDLETLLWRSDFITLHVHLTDATRGMLGPRQLASIRPGAVLINTSRGGLIDEAALIQEMESGRIAAAGLDVIDGEWLENKLDHPLIAYSRRNPRLYITPHVGGTCPEAGRLTARHTFRKIVRFFSTPVDANHR